jgi:hypothetical protein
MILKGLGGLVESRIKSRNHDFPLKIAALPQAKRLLRK